MKNTYIKNKKTMKEIFIEKHKSFLRSVLGAGFEPADVTSMCFSLRSSISTVSKVQELINKL